MDKMGNLQFRTRIAYLIPIIHIQQTMPNSNKILSSEGGLQIELSTPSLEELYQNRTINDTDVFKLLFSAAELRAEFDRKFSRSSGKGIDRLNGFQFSTRANNELEIASRKSISGQYKFTPYLESLVPKGRNKVPRLIGIPTIRDRVVLHQLNRFLATVYPERVPRNMASALVRRISEDLLTQDTSGLWICGVDIMTFYDSIQRDRLFKLLRKQIKCKEAIKLIERAVLNPNVPKNTHRRSRKEYTPREGVPQGLAISNILASIYMKDIDDAMQTMQVSYFRYVDDILIYGGEKEVRKALISIRSRLKTRGLSIHELGKGKGHMGPISKPFGYLGYTFQLPLVTVRKPTVERFLQSVAAKFSDYVHNKKKRLEQKKYLDEERLSKIFLLELNERITGAVSGHKRYGWVAYYNQVNDLTLLHEIDCTISKMFSRLDDFGNRAPKGLKKLGRAYYEMKFNPQAGYVHNYDALTTREQKLSFLVERGRVGEDERLTDEQINDRFESYKNKSLSEMHADEGVIY